MLCSDAEEKLEVLFQAVKDLLHVSKADGPFKLSSDFELATSNAFITIFRNTSVQYCYFNFSQYLWRRVQAIRLVSIYKRKEKEDKCTIKQTIIDPLA